MRKLCLFAVVGALLFVSYDAHAVYGFSVTLRFNENGNWYQTSGTIPYNYVRDCNATDQAGESYTNANCRVYKFSVDGPSVNASDEIAVSRECFDPDWDYTYLDWDYWRLTDSGDSWNMYADDEDDSCPIVGATEDGGVGNDDYSPAGTRVWRVQHSLYGGGVYQGEVYIVD